MLRLFMKPSHQDSFLLFPLNVQFIYVHCSKDFFRACLLISGTLEHLWTLTPSISFTFKNVQNILDSFLQTVDSCQAGVWPADSCGGWRCQGAGPSDFGGTLQGGRYEGQLFHPQVLRFSRKFHRTKMRLVRHQGPVYERAMPVVENQSKTQIYFWAEDNKWYIGPHDNTDLVGSWVSIRFGIRIWWRAGHSQVWWIWWWEWLASHRSVLGGIYDSILVKLCHDRKHDQCAPQMVV